MGENKLQSIAEPLRSLMRQLISRCDKAGIEHELNEWPWGNNYYLNIYLPSGRDKRKVWVVNSEDAEKLNGVEFEKYVFVQGYESICSYEYGLIEAYIKLPTPARAEVVMGRLLDIPYRKRKEMKKEDLVLEVKQQVTSENPITITISQPTNTMLALTGREVDEESGLSIKIANSRVSNSEQAMTILEKLANSLFFQIRNSRVVPLTLETYYDEPSITSPLIISTQKDKKTPIAFPKYQYDADPLNLYWYAASAYKMPLLRFLAYYQVLEFYFPIYSAKEVQAEVANILKDPQFDPNYPLDVRKVISTVLSKMGRGYSDERSQLHATIKGCLQDKEVRELMERDEIKEYFKSDYKKLSPVKVSVDSKDLDLREQLAERLYDIRCRIVHTKAEETEKQPILPFTKEEALLIADANLIEFVAHRAIIAGSKKLAI